MHASSGSSVQTVDEESIAREGVEVRRCARCMQATVLQVANWKHFFYDESTGHTTRDYRCQSCGARFGVRSSNLGLIVVGILLLPIGVGAVLLLVARRRSRKEQLNPIVPNAAPPLVRFHEGPPLRRCGSCSSASRVVEIKRATHNGIPMGSEYRYECSSCHRRIEVDSPWRKCTRIMSTAVLLGIAWTGRSSETWWRFASLALGAGGLVIAGQLALRLIREARAPEVEGDRLEPPDSFLRDWFAGS